MPWNNKGFTLVELVMTMVVLGILSATALPKFFETRIFVERAFFDDTLNAVRYAQKLAVVTGCAVQVIIMSDAYQLKKRGTSSSTTCPITGSTYSLDVPHPGSRELSYSGSETGVTLTSTHSSFIFYPLGNASADVTLTVGLRKITVVSETGFVYDST